MPLPPPLPPPPLVRPSSVFCRLITAALEPPIAPAWLPAWRPFTLVFAIPVVAIPVVALVAEACGPEWFALFCANAAGAAEISNAAAEIKTNLCMVVSSRQWSPQIQNPERSDVFPFMDACMDACMKRIILRSVEWRLHRRNARDTWNRGRHIQLHPFFRAGFTQLNALSPSLPKFKRCGSARHGTKRKTRN
jgi:hypothetical protein